MISKLYHSFVKEKTNSVTVQLFRHTISGVVAFSMDFTLLCFLKEIIGWNYQIATICGYSIGILITYLFSTKWIFHNRKFKNKSVELLLFITLNLIGLAINSLFMWLFTSVGGIYYLYSKILTTGIVYFWNFFSKKITLF